MFTNIASAGFRITSEENNTATLLLADNRFASCIGIWDLTHTDDQFPQILSSKLLPILCVQMFWHLHIVCTTFFLQMKKKWEMRLCQLVSIYTYLYLLLNLLSKTFEFFQLCFGQPVKHMTVEVIDVIRNFASLRRRYSGPQTIDEGDTLISASGIPRSFSENFGSLSRIFTTSSRYFEYVNSYICNI